MLLLLLFTKDCPKLMFAFLSLWLYNESVQGELLLTIVSLCLYSRVVNMV